MNDMKNPLISIIVPVYNVEHYIADCIDSIVSQSYKRLELILVDDGSSDNSFAICENYSQSDSRIRLMTVNRGGVSAARNLGKDYAKGDYVLFVDSDDVLLPDALMHYVDNVNRTNADVIKSGWEAHFYDGRVITHSYDKDVLMNDCSKFFTLVQSTQYSTFIWNTLFAKRIISEIRFDTSICWLEDHIFSYQCLLKAKSFSLIKDITYRYMVRKRTSLSNIINPYMICKAANKEISLKQRILNGNDINQIKREWYGYHNKIEKAISVIYENPTSYTFRKRFCQTIIRSSEITVFTNEKIFFNYEIPFALRDLFLILRTKIIKNINFIKSIIKR